MFKFPSCWVVLTVSAYSSILYIIAAECHICSHEVPGGAGHPPGLDGEISLAGGINDPRPGLRSCRGFAHSRYERDSKSPDQCSSSAIPAASRQTWRALPARDISRVFIKMEITSLSKSASPSLTATKGCSKGKLTRVSPAGRHKL